MILYSIYQSNRMGATNGKFYARAHHVETIDLNGLAEHMVGHNAGYSKGQILGLLNDMVSCIRELTLDGYKIKLPNLGIFSAGITSKGAKTVKEYNANEHIVRERICCLPSGDMRLSTEDDDVKFKRVELVSKAEDGTIEGGGTPDGGGGTPDGGGGSPDGGGGTPDGGGGSTEDGGTTILPNG